MENNKKLNTLIIYLDDDDKVKNKYVIIVEETPHGIELKFPDSKDTFFLPWARVLKIKHIGANEE